MTLEKRWWRRKWKSGYRKSYKKRKAQIRILANRASKLLLFSDERAKIHIKTIQSIINDDFLSFFAVKFRFLIWHIYPSKWPNGSIYMAFCHLLSPPRGWRPQYSLSSVADRNNLGHCGSIATSGLCRCKPSFPYYPLGRGCFRFGGWRCRMKRGTEPPIWWLLSYS